MAHEIQALIGPHQSLHHLASFWSHAIVRELKFGFVSIPLTDELLHQILHPETEYDENTAPRFHFPDLEDSGQCARLSETISPEIGGIISINQIGPMAAEELKRVAVLAAADRSE